MKPLPRSWFAGDAVLLAPKLLGKVVRKGSCAGIIVETEAYTVDPASHAYRLTPRSRIMRGTAALRNLASGPAKFCQAFGIGRADNGTAVGDGSAVYDAPALTKRDIGVSGRIGIRSSTDLPWRFYIKDNPFVSPVRNQGPKKRRR